MKLYRQVHVAYKTQDHLVWVPRYRRNILVLSIAEYLKKVLCGVRNFTQIGFWRKLEWNGTMSICPW